MRHTGAGRPHAEVASTAGSAPPRSIDAVHPSVEQSSGRTKTRSSVSSIGREPRIAIRTNGWALGPNPDTPPSVRISSDPIGVAGSARSPFGATAHPDGAAPASAPESPESLEPASPGRASLGARRDRGDAPGPSWRAGAEIEERAASRGEHRARVVVADAAAQSEDALSRHDRRGRVDDVERSLGRALGLRRRIPRPHPLPGTGGRCRRARRSGARRSRRRSSPAPPAPTCASRRRSPARRGGAGCARPPDARRERHTRPRCCTALDVLLPELEERRARRGGAAARRERL